MDSRLPGSQLVNVYCRNALLRQCKGTVRRGEFKIDGFYNPSVIQDAFGGYGEWRIARKGGWSHGIHEIRDQATLARMLSFQLSNSLFICACEIACHACPIARASRRASRNCSFRAGTRRLFGLKESERVSYRPIKRRRLGMGVLRRDPLPDQIQVQPGRVSIECVRPHWPNR